MPEPAIVLVAHGSRDPKWAAPLQALRDELASTYAGPVRLAFLDYTQPDVATTIAELVGNGCRDLVVVPAFLGAGRHARLDLPPLITTARDKHPGLAIRLTAALGQSPAVIAGIAKGIPPLLDGR